MEKMKFILLAVFCNMLSFTYGQGRLEYEREEVVFLPRNGKSAIVIKCDSVLPKLSFYSNTVEFKAPEVISQGGQINYLLELDMRRANAGVVNISAPGFATLGLPVDVEKTNEAYVYKIFDPDGPLAQGYFRYRREAEKAYNDGDYQKALSEYEIAKKCSNARIEEADERIESIKNIQLYYEAAKDSFKHELYRSAGELFAMIISINPNDKVAQDRLNECNTQLDEICTSSMTTAERYYRNHQFYKAQPFYKTMIENKCSNIQLAQTRYDEIEQIRYKKRVLPHVISYMFDKDKPLNIGYGTFNERKGGGYFNVRFNKELLDAIQDDWIPKIDGNGVPSTFTDSLKSITNHAQFAFSFGWTIKIICPNPELSYFKAMGMMFPKYPSLHIFFGPGYTGTLVYEYSKQKTTEDEKKTYKTKLVSAITPQVGLMLKWGRLSAYYVFEYHYKLKNEIEHGKTYHDLSDIDCIKKSKSYFGLGFAF